MRNIRLVLAYDGTDYVGWQVQPNGLSVQAVVEQALAALLGHDVHVWAAGRTDSGVHARGQTANFFTPHAIPCDALQRGLQSKLPADIAVRDVREVPAEFHATYSATGKRYRYVIHDDPIPDPVLRRFAWHWRRRLDDRAMHEAAQALVGTHDFRSFESHWPNRASSVRTVREAVVVRCAGWAVWDPAPLGDRAVVPCAADHGSCVCFDIVADGFLYNMVRAIVGSLVKVGQGRAPLDELARIVAAQDRAAAHDTAPPHGLHLMEVSYDGPPRTPLPGERGA